MAPSRPSSFSLRAVPLLAGLAPDRLEALAGQCRWRSVEAGKRVVSRQADDGDVIFILSGKVRVTTYAASGREVAFRDLDSGDYVGDVAAVDGLPRSADVVTLQTCLLAQLDRADFRQLLIDEPVVAQRVMARLAALVRQLSQRVIDLSTLGVQNRLHAELLRRVRDAGVQDNRARLDPAPRHVELASRISTNREQVSRELSALAKQGVLAKDGKALWVQDVALLETMVAEVRLQT